MKVVRRYLLAPSLGRLIMHERPGTRIVEGHFPPSDKRRSYVLFEDSSCELVLITNPGSATEEEERTDVPAKQGQFLLEVCAGTLVYHRVSVAMGNGWDALVNSFSIPGSLHQIEVEFEDQQQADGFVAPRWFGPEVAEDQAFDHSVMATGNFPDQPIVPISEEGLHAVLDALDEAGRSRWSLPRGVEPLRAVQQEA